MKFVRISRAAETEQRAYKGRAFLAFELRSGLCNHKNSRGEIQMAHRKFQRPNLQRFGASRIDHSSMRRVLLTAASLWLVGALQFAAAQVPTNNGSQPTTGKANATSAPESGPAGNQLEEVIVTAQRRAQSLQDVPVAVTAVSAAMLEAVGIQNTSDLQELTPGLTTPEMNGYFQPHIRGVGTTTNGAAVENPVALYIDGVYIANPPSALLSLNNIDRIEVDKGPQGTLFGRNATGGLIQVITRDPQKTPHLDADVSYGNYQDVISRLYATDGLTSDLSADVAVRYEHQGDGFGHNFYDGSDVGKVPHDLAARSKFLFEPTSATQVRLTLDYEDRDSTQSIFHLGTQYPGTFNNFFFGGPFPQGGPYDVNQNQRFDTLLQGGGAALQINEDFGAAALESITAYRKSTYSFFADIDLVPVNILSFAARQNDQQFSQEVHISGTDAGKLKWTGGLYYFYAKDGWSPFGINFGPSVISPIPGVPVTLDANNDQITNSLAGYGQASYEVLADTNLTLGGRYTYERKNVNGTETFSVAGAPGFVTPFPTPALGIPTTSQFNNFSYRIALDHKFGANVLGYMSYSTGFKSGGYNLAAGANPPYQPEDIKASEVGLKSELFDRRLRLNVSAFNYIYNNIQVAEDHSDTEIIVNGAKAKMYGADIDAEFAVVAGLTLNGGFSYIHDRFVNYPNAQFIVPVDGCVPPFGGVCSGSANGKELPYTPTISWNLGGDYKWELAIGAITFNANYFRSGSFYGASDNVAIQKAYGLVNTSIMWSDRENHLRLGVYGRNLSNTVYATSVSETTPGESISLGEPRMYGVTIGYKF
jgi:iron complex outermembrane receptor protein